jgi:hypothetical protein
MSSIVFDKLLKALFPQISVSSSTPGKPNRIKLLLALLTQLVIVARLPLVDNPLAQW